MIKLLSVAVIAGFLSLEPADGQVSKLSSQFQSLKPAPPPIQPVCWTEWFDRDDPSGTGDWEVLSHLRKENPGMICPNPTDIEVQTLSGQSLAAAGEVIYKADPSYGFVCRNMDQKDKFCQDYRVRFSCPPSFCRFGACWTPWYDRDDPSGTGDWETLASLKLKYPNEICNTPIYIDAVTVAGDTPASSTGETFHTFNPTEGFVCRKEDQADGKCLDYKVSFGCCCN